MQGIEDKTPIDACVSYEAEVANVGRQPNDQIGGNASIQAWQALCEADSLYAVVFSHSQAMKYTAS